MATADQLSRLIGFLEAQLASPPDQRAPGSSDAALEAALTDARTALRLAEEGVEQDAAELLRIVAEIEREVDEHLLQLPFDADGPR